LSANFSVAERDPFAFGLKLTLIVQLRLCESELPQVLLVTRKSAEFEPMIVTPVSVKTNISAAAIEQSTP